MLRRFLFTSLFLITLFFLKPNSVAAQSFGCNWSSADSQCYLHPNYTFGGFPCPPPTTQTEADTYCSQFNSQSACDFTFTNPISCSVLLPPTPTPTLLPTATPIPCPNTATLSCRTVGVCDGLNGTPRFFACTPGFVCCDTSGAPPPTATPVLPSPTPTTCTPAPCGPGYFQCFNNTTCCLNPASCPPINVLFLPLCTTHGECVIDWEGRFGDAVNVFDRFRSCEYNSTTNIASCKIIFCDNGNGIYSALGCIPFKNVKDTISAVLMWSIGISGGIALIILVYAAFLLMFSFGDPKRVQLGKELALSTLMSIVFIVLSLVILNFIGTNVLNLGPLGFSV